MNDCKTGVGNYRRMRSPRPSFLYKNKHQR